MAAVVFGALGWWVSLAFDLSSTDSGFLPWGVVFSASGAVIGAMVPFIVTGPGRGLGKYISEVPGRHSLPQSQAWWSDL